MVDLLANKAYTFERRLGKMTTGPVPDDLADEVEAARETLIEDIAEADDSLMERYLEGEELSADDLAKGLAKGVRERLFLPVAASRGPQEHGRAAGHGPDQPPAALAHRPGRVARASTPRTAARSPASPIRPLPSRPGVQDRGRPLCRPPEHGAGVLGHPELRTCSS